MNVLLVEDDDGVRAVLEEFLRARGHQVASASGARAAREALFADGGAPHPFDLALIDWSLPDLSGRQLVLLLGEQLPGCRVVVTTGLGESVVSERLAGQAVAAVLRKPFSVRELLPLLATPSTGK